MTLILSGTNGVSDVDGTAATPAIRGTDTNTGIFFPAADTIAFSEGGVESARFDSAGNLGIGTSSPSARLGVAGNVFISGVSPYIAFDTTQSGSTPAFIQYASSSLIFGAGSAERMRLDSSGNLGLGVTPSAWRTGFSTRAIQVGPVGSLSSLQASTTNNQTYLSSNAFLGTTDWIYQFSDAATQYRQFAGQHQWFTAPSGTAGNAISFTQAMTLDASGRLGIARTSPSASLDVAGDAIFTRGVGYNTSVNSFIELGGTDNGFVDNNRTSTWRFYVAGNASDGQSLRFEGFLRGGTWTERARITSSGNLLVGTTSAAETTAGVKIISYSASSANVMIGDAVTTNDNVRYILYSTGASAYRFYVGMGGTIFATSTSISAISDVTLKENVRDLETGLTEVMALRPRRFDWKNGDAHDVAGFVAQEVEQVLPELVTDYLYNKDEQGNDIIKKSLKMGDILPTLVKAIQEQQAIIQTLTTRIAALEAK